MLQLYNYSRSSSSFRVRIALALKGLAYEDIQVHLLNNGGEQHTSQYNNMNPHHLVPTLSIENKIVSQSLAIIEYLDELHPTPALLPGDAYEKALARGFAYAIAADLQPLNNLRVLHYLSDELHVTEEVKLTWYKHWIKTNFNALEQNLKKWQLTGDYCFGNTPTLADICLVPQLYNARRYACDLSAYPTLVRIDANCQANPTFQQAWPAETT